MGYRVDLHDKESNNRLGYLREVTGELSLVLPHKGHLIDGHRPPKLIDSPEDADVLLERFLKNRKLHSQRPLPDVKAVPVNMSHSGSLI